MSSTSSTSSSPLPGDRHQRYVRAHPHFRPPNRSRRQNVDYGMRNSLAQMGTRELHGMDVYRWEDDDLSLRSAAAQARLPYDRMTKKELEIFPEISRAQASTALFLYIRNRILVLWQLDPLVELTVDVVLKELPEPFDSDVELVTGIHAYLQRYGYINFGVFHQISNRCLDSKKTIIVIGAGASGLAAARQLQFFGFNVIVLEGRNRTCGRVRTMKQTNLPPADLGAMIITGIVGNPLVTLIQQVPVNVFRVNHRCPIYDHQGKLVNSRKDDMIERSFNRILGTISYLAHGMGVTKVGGDGERRKISLGKAFEHILNQQELRVQVKRLNYWKKYQELVNKLERTTNQVIIYRKTIDDCMKRLRANGVINAAETTPEMVSIDYDEFVSDEQFQRQLTVRCLRKCLEMALTKHDEVEKERKNIEHVLMDYQSMEPSYVYMNSMDKRILDFHLANLEYGIGSSLDSVAIKDWDQDDPYGFTGSHITVKEGLGNVVGRLSAGLDVRYDHVVDRIIYDEKGVSIQCRTGTKKQHHQQHQDSEGIKRAKVETTGEPIYLEADAVLCTVPLGVLKRSSFTAAADEDEPPGSGTIRFEPMLPRWKREAISKLGFGSLNKIILFFEKPFWDIKRSSFGRLNDTPVSRGELFMFYSNGNLPVLIGIFAGQAASITSQVDEKIIMQKAMNNLHSIFSNNCPAEPIRYVVTRWHTDKFSLGCYSYMSLNSSAEDYDTLARPVHPNGDEEAALPRVFFAGEHTNRQYPASVHGAFLSGLREAAKMADIFIGPLSSSGEITSTISAKELASLREEQQSVRDVNLEVAGTSRQATQRQQHTHNNYQPLKNEVDTEQREAASADDDDDDIQLIE